MQARSAGDGDDLSLGADAREGFFVQAGRIVVAELADVAGAEAPGLTGNDGCGYLAAGAAWIARNNGPWSRAAEIARAELECPWH